MVRSWLMVTWQNCEMYFGFLLFLNHQDWVYLLVFHNQSLSEEPFVLLLFSWRYYPDNFFFVNGETLFNGEILFNGETLFNGTDYEDFVNFVGNDLKDLVLNQWLQNYVCFRSIHHYKTDWKLHRIFHLLHNDLDRYDTDSFYTV